MSMCSPLPWLRSTSFIRSKAGRQIREMNQECSCQIRKFTIACIAFATFSGSSSIEDVLLQQNTKKRLG